MCVQGDNNSNALVTIGCDGKICSWSADRPRRPTVVRDSQQLVSQNGFASAASFRSTGPQHSDGKNLSSALGANAVIGTHDGLLFAVAAKNARTLEVRRFCDGGDVRHDATVTSVDAHPPHADRRVADLVLTTSLDRSCRVWLEAQCIVIEGFTDDVYDAKWSPTAPSVFACVDASGSLHVFNIASSVSVPCASLCFRQSSSPTSLAHMDGSEAGGHLHKAFSTVSLQWDDSGHCIACGTSTGEVLLVDVTLPEIPADVAAKHLADWIAAASSQAS
jgi:dynein intermediate chain